jgi:Tol biopolymer transport system component
MESHGGNLKKIRSGPVATGLSWSPDGRQLVFYGSRERQAEKAGKEIYVIDCNGLMKGRSSRTLGATIEWRN